MEEEADKLLKEMGGRGGIRWQFGETAFGGWSLE